MAGPNAGPASEAEAGAVLTVNLDALARNWQRAREASGSAECGAAVKGNAYGIGIDQAARRLIAEGCRTFFVAHVAEGRALRAVDPGIVIYVLNGIAAGAESALWESRLRPVLNTAADIRNWAAFCDGAAMRLPAAVHIDTGMNRLGLPEAEIRAVAEEPPLFERFELALVMSHLACADMEGHETPAQQRERFERLRALLPPAPASLCNSAGLFLGPDFHYDVTRPGVSLYGGSPFVERENPFELVVRLDARILQVREIAAGDTIGYGATFTAEGPMRIATVGVGYADGIHRLCGNHATAYVDGAPVPYVGRVSMDLLTLDVTGLPEARVRPGSSVELLGPNATVDALARAAGTIGYEVLTNLGPRYLRRYVSGAATGS